MSTINKQKDLEIGGETFTIKPFVLRNRDKVLKIVASSFGELSKKFSDLKNAPQGDVAMTFIEIAGDKITEIYELVLGKDKEWLLDNMTIEDEVNLISTVMELNNLPLLLSQIKQLRGQIKG